jgi:hypothetical protein
MATLVAVGTSLAADRTVSATLEGPPSAWLSGTGKSEEWKATTLRCRELLQKINLQDALVQKNLPQLKAKVQLLLRSPDFDWKKKTAGRVPRKHVGRSDRRARAARAVCRQGVRLRLLVEDDGADRGDLDSCATGV